MKFFAALLVVLASLTTASGVEAQSAASSSISIERPWARATPSGARTGAVYVTIANHGAAADRLLGASTPVADKVQFHREIEDDGVMRMRELRTVDIGPGASFTFKPGGAHMMLFGLKHSLKEGEVLPLTLELEKAGKIDVQVRIAKAAAAAPHDMSGMQH